MTTTEPFAMTPPSGPTPRRMRRSRTDRIGAGVAGGLGDYFGVDPVLFRVLFATAAFFGGAGVLAYLLAWAVIPEQGTERASIDGWVATLRRHRVPFWVVVTGAAFLLWLVAFSWWAPGPFVPVIAIVLIVLAIASRRTNPGAPMVSLTKPDVPAAQPSEPSAAAAGAPSPSAPTAPSDVDPTAAPTTQPPPAWMTQTRSWINEAREARRERSRRAMPIRIGVLVTFVLTMVVLGLVDAAHGIAIATYFWYALAILGGAFLISLVLRRTVWGLLLLIIPVAAGTIGLAGSPVGLRSGIGQQQWQPTAAPNSSYSLAFGQGVLDLRSTPISTESQTVNVDVAAGRVKIILPSDRNVTVHANVHFGSIDSHVIGAQPSSDANGRWHGVNVTHTLYAPSGPVGAPLTVDVHLADGNVTVVRR